MDVRLSSGQAWAAAAGAAARAFRSVLAPGASCDRAVSLMMRAWPSGCPWRCFRRRRALS